MKTVKNRKRKFALGMKIAALCSCLVLASVGFASWLVIHEPDDRTAAGSVEVALTAQAQLLVDELAVNQTLATNLTTNKFSFGKPATPEVPMKWLVPQGVEKEDMAEEYTLKFKPQNLPANTKVKFTLNFDAVTTSVVESTTNYTEVNTRLATLISKDYLTLTITVGEGVKAQSVTYDKTNALPSTGGVVNYDVDWATLQAAQNATQDDKKSISLPLTIQFGWGDAFELERTVGEEQVTKNWNPYIYYNSLENPTAQQKEAALDVLAEIAAEVKGLDKTAIKNGAVTESTPTPNALSYKVLIDAELDLSGVEY